MNRGDHQERIFADDADRRVFLATLGEVCQKTGWQIHSFCLMSNHFHVVMETPSANLVEGMKWFLGVYTRRFNRRKKPMTISLTDTFFLFHQKPGMDLPIGFLAGLAQCFQEQLAVFVRAENWLLMVAPIHDVVDGAGIL